jgi:ABC-type nitrate/sulfonate/bicarbonate transport system substrate-binding protein
MKVWIQGRALLAAAVSTTMFATAMLATTGAAQAQDKLRVIVFAGMSNIPQFAAEAQGFYKKRNLAVELIYTPNSTELRRGLAEGRYDIAHGGVDNAVAQVEDDKTDLFMFMGGNSGMNSLFVQPEINSYEDLRGKIMAVDSPHTAFALLLYKMLDVKGIKRNEYEVKAVGATHLRLEAMLKDKSIAAAMLSPPGSVGALNKGLKDLGSAVSVVGPYQSDGGWVLRSWGKANADMLVRYISANIEGLRWALNPANRPALTALAAQRLKQSPELVTASLKVADEQKAYATDARFDIEGFRNVLRLRADMLGTWGGKPPAPEKYLDLSYYDRALKGL